MNTPNDNGSRPIPYAPTCSKWRGFAVALLLATVSACAGAAAKASGEAYRCPPGTFDYGDGMVASSLPKDATQALCAAHASALEQAGERRSSFLAHLPWRPHVSVIYGVTPARAEPAQRALQAFVEAHGEAVTACFGSLHYWDDAQGNKTTLVVDVHEAGDKLVQLHDALAEAVQIQSRFAYHPHVTLAYLQLGTRLDAAQERAVTQPLAQLCWEEDGFYLTNPCGQELFRAGGAERKVQAK